MLDASDALWLASVVELLSLTASLNIKTFILLRLTGCCRKGKSVAKKANGEMDLTYSTGGWSLMFCLDR